MEEKLEGFIKGHFIPLQSDVYDIRLGASEFPGHAALFFIPDPDRLIAYNQQGERYEQKLNADSYYVYNKGYGGYALFAQLPPNFPPIELIAPLTRSWKTAPLPRKREEAKPLIRLLVKTPNHEEILTLSFDHFAQGFKWPLLKGHYLARFQSKKIELPFTLRLKKARQINYPGTAQPYSYEATLLIDHEEAPLSMNHVFEKKGYRFYLANLIQRPSGAHQVQIVINHDPAKYWLTYPGALILACGILLLFLKKRYTAPKN